MLLFKPNGSCAFQIPALPVIELPTHVSLNYMDHLFYRTGKKVVSSTKRLDSRGAYYQMQQNIEVWTAPFQ